MGVIRAELTEPQAALLAQPARPAVSPRPLLPFARSGYFLALATLSAFAAAELVTTYVDPIAGIAVHAVILSLLIPAASLAGDDAAGHVPARFLYSLSVVPLIRILSLSMPLTRFEPAVWYLMAGLPVFLAGIVIAATLGLRPSALGLRPSRSLLQPLVVVLGFGLGFAEYQILGPESLIDNLTVSQFVLPALILMVATGFLEEFVFRGVLQATAVPLLGWAGIVYVSLVFAVLHIGYRSLADIAFVFVIALIYAWVARRTGSIMGVSVSHGITNIVLFLVVPFVPALAARPEWLSIP